LTTEALYRTLPEQGESMSDLSFHLKAADGHQIAVYHWPTRSPRGVVHILHGMAEHGGRYAAVADRLNQAGWSVVAHDHRGHGLSVSADGLRGHYADEHGWERVQDDVHVVQGWIASQYPGMARVLLGHSMGSFIAMAYALAQAASLDGLVLSSSDLKPTWFYRVLQVILGIEKLRCGARGTSALVRSLSFDAFARKIPQRQTDYDWLSRNPDEVRKYIDDPLCGHDCSMQLWRDMIAALKQISLPGGLAQLDPDLPVLMVAGEDDPMSDFGKGVARIEAILKKHRPANLHVQRYAGGRHELFNDIDREQVLQDLTGWLDSAIQRR